MTSVLFGGNTSNQSQNRYLVEFKAGKMSMRSGRMISADKRKGLVYIHQTDDEMIHFCWKDRNTNRVEDDLIIFPEESEFKKVPECTTGRVYVLKFKASSRRCFFWLQEPRTDRDSEYCTKVNQFLNDPSSRSTQNAPNTVDRDVMAQLQEELDNIEDEGLRNLVRNLDPEHLLQLLPAENLSALGLLRPGSSARSGSSQIAAPQPVTPVVVSTPSAPTVEPSSSTTPAVPVVQLGDLQKILSELQVPMETSVVKPIDLSNAIKAEALKPLFDNKELMNCLRNLLPPTSGSDQGSSSSDFQLALSQFNTALQSGLLAPVLEQFQMPSEVVGAANSGNMDVFVRAMQDYHRTLLFEDDDDDDDEEDMNIG